MANSSPFAILNQSLPPLASPCESRSSRLGITAFLANTPAQLRDEIRKSAKQIYEVANAYLEDAAKVASIDLDSFYPALESHLKTRFPWMQDASFNALCSYTGWFSWHEGYLTTASQWGD